MMPSTEAALPGLGSAMKGLASTEGAARQGWSPGSPQGTGTAGKKLQPSL